MSRNTENFFDLNALLHPAQAFNTPDDVVLDPDLTLNEKRAILASWASDACAVDSSPVLRRAPNGRVVTFEQIIDALRTLDESAKGEGLKAGIGLRRPPRPTSTISIGGCDA